MKFNKLGKSDTGRNEIKQGVALSVFESNGFTFYIEDKGTEGVTVTEAQSGCAIKATFDNAADAMIIIKNASPEEYARLNARVEHVKQELLAYGMQWPVNEPIELPQLQTT